MTEINSTRMLSKLFKCPSCNKNFKNLVQFHISNSKCPFCHHEQCSEIINNYSNQEIRNENNNSTNNNSNNTNRRSNYNIYNTNISEIHNNEIEGIIVRARIDINRNNEEESSNDNVINNIADNIISNILGLTESFVIINRVPFQNDINPPVEQNVIDKLKHFKMEQKYYKKQDQEDKIEFPKCTICLMEISEGMDCISMPCEHFFHDKCVTQWLKIHNTCPLCRFELSDNNLESQDEIGQQIERNLHQIINNNLGRTTSEDVD